MNDQQRSLAAHAFNAAWDALEADEFISAVELARESLRLWREIGGHRELCVGEWMVGRTRAYAGDFAAARVAAGEAEQELNALGAEAEDWLHASVAELHARAHSNEPASVNYHHFYETAQTLIAGIHDPEDRGLIEAQFSDLPNPE
jgi:hypothetical protein